MTRQEIIDKIVAFVDDEIGLHNVVDVENNLGGMHFDMANGSTMFLMAGQCEEEENEDEEEKEGEEELW